MFEGLLLPPGRRLFGEAGSRMALQLRGALRGAQPRSRLAPAGAKKERPE